MSLFFALLIALLFASGCARRETDVEAGIRTQTLIVGNGTEPGSLDPQVANLLNDWRIVRALFEGLASFDERTAQSVPGVAERWEVSPDGLVYTFHLRPDARWSNGDPLTAEDFVLSLQRMLLPALGSPNSNQLWPIRNAKAFNKGMLTDFAEVGASALDAHTLRVVLERPTPYLPALTAMFWLPVHRATIERFGRIDDRSSAWTRPGNLVGNGPFLLTDWKLHDRVVVQRNPNYWDAGHTRLDSVVFLPNENVEAEERNFRAGQVHVTWGLPPWKIARYRADDPSKLRIEPMLHTKFLWFNVSRPPLDRIGVRRALSLAIDRESIVHAAHAGTQRPAACFVPPDCGGYTARARVPTDFASARQLLAEAGFPRGEGLPTLEVQLGVNNATETKTLEIIQETWRRELGVEITLHPMEQKTGIQNMQTRDYTIDLGGWLADFPDPANFLEIFLSDSGNNWTGWADPDYDRLIDEASHALEQESRFESFQRAEALLLEEAVVAPISFSTSIYLIDPSVRNWEPAPLLLRRFQLVWLEP